MTRRTFTTLGVGLVSGLISSSCGGGKEQIKSNFKESYIVDYRAEFSAHNRLILPNNELIDPLKGKLINNSDKIGANVTNIKSFGLSWGNGCYNRFTGEIYVAGSGIDAYNKQGDFLRKIVSFYDVDREILSRLAVAPDGTIWGCGESGGVNSAGIPDDDTTHRIVHCDTSGNILKIFNYEADLPPFGPLPPRGFAINSKGEILVARCPGAYDCNKPLVANCPTGGCYIDVYNAEGIRTRIIELKAHPAEDPKGYALKYIKYMQLDKNDNMYILNSLDIADGFFKFDPEGNMLARLYGQFGPGRVGYLGYVQVDEEGKVFLGDYVYKKA
jgi:hypothetical protein